jgi:hypothetical protein
MWVTRDSIQIVRISNSMNGEASRCTKYAMTTYYTGNSASFNASSYRKPHLDSWTPFPVNWEIGVSCPDTAWGHSCTSTLLRGPCVANNGVRLSLLRSPGIPHHGIRITLLGGPCVADDGVSLTLLGGPCVADDGVGLAFLGGLGIPHYGVGFSYAMSVSLHFIGPRDIEMHTDGQGTDAHKGQGQNGKDLAIHVG